MVTLSGGPGSAHAGVFQARPEGSRAHKDDSFSRRDTRRLRPRRPRVCTAGVCGPRDSLRRGAACAPGDARQHLRPAPTETPAADPGGVHDHPVVNPACRAQSHSVLGGQSRCARGRDPTRRVCDALRTARGRLSAVRGVGRAGQGTSRPIAGPGNEQAAGGWTDGQGGERTQPLRLLPSQEEAVLCPSQTQGCFTGACYASHSSTRVRDAGSERHAPAVPKPLRSRWTSYNGRTVKRIRKKAHSSCPRSTGPASELTFSVLAIWASFSSSEVPWELFWCCLGTFGLSYKQDDNLVGSPK